MRSECRVSTLRENSRFQLCTQPCRRGGRVWHCLHSLPVLPRRRPQRCDASFLDDARLPPPLSLARSREEANHRATRGRVLTFDRGLWSNNNNGWNGSDTVDTRIGERKPVRIIPERQQRRAFRFFTRPPFISAFDTSISAQCSRNLRNQPRLDIQKSEEYSSNNCDRGGKMLILSAREATSITAGRGRKEEREGEWRKK